LAGRAATVGRNGIPIVALLGSTNLLVTAKHCGDARLTRNGTDVVGLHRALGAAAVAAHGISVVTFLAWIEDAIAAARTRIGLHTSLRNVADGRDIRQRKNTYIITAVAIHIAAAASDTASRTGAASHTGPASAAAGRTGSPRQAPAARTAGSKAKPEAHDKPPAGYQPVAKARPRRKRASKGRPPMARGVLNRTTSHRYNSSHH
jgi:hypothetical protein